MVSDLYKKEMVLELASNFDFVQMKIDQIKEREEHAKIDIKQISDLEKYASMQKNIVSAIGVVNSL